MKIKYYGVPHNAQSLRSFLHSKKCNVSTQRCERLITLYKWFQEEPRQWENVGVVSFRDDSPPCYSNLKDSTFAADVRLLARVGLIFPIYASATPREEFVRRHLEDRIFKERLEVPQFREALMEAISSNPFRELLKR